MDINNIKNKDLEYFGYREEPYFASSIMIAGWFDKPRLNKIFGLRHGIRWFQVNYNLFQVKNDLARMEKDLRKILKNKDKAFVVQLNKRCLQTGKKLITFSRKASNKYVHTTDKKTLITVLEDYLEHLSSYTVFMTLAVFEKPVMDLAKSLVTTKHKNNHSTDNLLKLITSPSKQTAFEKEQEDFLRIASKNIKNKSSLANKHAERYGWLAIRYFLGEPWTKETIISRLKHIKAEDAKNSLNRKLIYNKQRAKEVAHAIKRFNLKERELIKTVRTVIYLRNKRADLFSEAACYARPFLAQVSRVLGITYEELLNLNIPEIILSLKGLFDYKTNINNRKHGFIIFHNPNKNIIYGGKVFDKYIKKKKFFLMEAPDICELKGKIAFTGKIKGRAKIVKNEADIKKVRVGDILVCPMTVPHFIPAMEKASAFVTDEGGLTCHAAIVAREMGKPCVIGTKIATKVFKDGDMIEVDANKGVIKKLK